MDQSIRPRFRAILALLLATLMLVGPGLVPAHAQGSSQTDQLKVTQYTLDNGLSVILVEDHSAPTVAVDIWYKVGGAYDPPGRSGFAHLFEHLMFQGSAHVARGEFDALINKAGGSSNASTGIDRTNYYEALPAHQLPLALWLEADRMASLVVDQANFDREREVVKEEYRQRIQNQPYGQAILTLQTIAYDYAPYSRPVIGSIQDLDAATLDEVRTFHTTYYKPSNAVLTVAGDIDVAQTQALIERFFSGIPHQSPPPTLPAYQFSVQQEAKEVSLKDQLARVPATLIAYRVPPRNDPDYYPLEVLARILGGGSSSRLAQALLDTGKAASASAGLQGNVGPSLFTVVLLPNQGVSVQELEDTYSQQLEQIRTQGVDQAELTKAVNQIRAGKLNRLETALGLAESVQAADFYLGSPDLALGELDRYQAVTSADIQRVVEKYLSSQSRNVIRVEPAAKASLPAGLSIPAMPVAARTPSLGVIPFGNSALSLQAATPGRVLLKEQKP